MRTICFFRSFVIGLSLILQIEVVYAQQEALTLKGWTSGQSPEVACRGKDITNMQDLVRKAGVHDLEVPVLSCSVKIDSVAGVPVTESAKLLFWRGRLMRVAMDLGWLDLESLAAVRGTLLETYGKPATRRSNPFLTDTWKRQSTQIHLERTDQLPSNSGLYLTENNDWIEYQRVIKKLNVSFDAQKKINLKNDLKN